MNRIWLILCWFLVACDEQPAFDNVQQVRRDLPSEEKLHFHFKEIEEARDEEEQLNAVGNFRDLVVGYGVEFFDENKVVLPIGENTDFDKVQFVVLSVGNTRSSMIPSQGREVLFFLLGE